MGFDIECIQNIQSLAGEYFCPVCRLLVYPDEALQTQCTHLYCKSCLAYVVSNTHTCPYDGYPVTEAEAKPLKEVNQTLAETIGRIAVTCLYHRSGCTWQGTLSESTNHCSGCSFGNSPVMCNRCGAQIVHRQVLEHSQICPGELPLAQQVDNTAAATEQGQASQPGVPAFQDQNTQTTVAPSGQGQSQGTSVTQSTAVVQAPTPEQWYQQQQQYYQQYYQQYPGYDPYQQQYQQYAQYHQQQFSQQVPVHPQQMPGQPHSQPYMQPQPLPHAQPQPQVQPQPQTQVQAPVQPQPQPQVQPPPQVQPQSQPQPQPQSQMPVQSQLPPQVNPQQQPHAPVQAQTHPPSHTQSQVHPSGHLPHPQPHPQPHSQMSQHPPPHSQLPNVRPHVQHPPQQQPHHPHAHPQSHLQHLRMQSQPPLAQPPPYPQAPPQTQPSHFQPHPQSMNPSAHAVTGHQSYPQPRPYQQMPPGGAQQHPMNVQSYASTAGAQQMPQNPSQFLPQQPPHMRPPNPVPHSHVPGQHPHQPSMLPAQGQHLNVPHVQQQLQQSYPQAHHPGHQTQHQPGMQPLQHQSVPHQQAHGIIQSQPFPGPAPTPAQNQPSQHGILMAPQPLQQQQQPLRAQTPSALQQHAQNHPQWLQNVPPSQGMTSHQQQNPSGRLMPGHGAMQPQHLHPGGGVAGPTHGLDTRSLIKPGQPGGGQLCASSVPQSGSQSRLSAADGPSILSHEDFVPEKVTKVPDGEVEAVSNGKDSATANIGVDSADSKISKSENNSKSRGDEVNPNVVTEDGDAPSGCGKEMESSNNKADLEDPAKKMMVKEEASERLSVGMTLENREDALKKDEASLLSVKEEGDGLPHDSLSSQKLEVIEGKNVKMQQDAADLQSPQLLFDAKNAISKGHVPGNEKSSMHASQQLPAAVGIEKNNQPPLQNVGPSNDKPLNNPGYKDGIMPQFPLQGHGLDEYRGFPPPVQLLTAQPGYPAPSPYGQPPLIHDGSQRQPAPHQMHMQGQMRPQGPLQGHPSTLHGSVATGTMPAASFGREPGRFGHPRGLFEPYPTHGPNQGPPPHVGGPRFSQGEPFAGPPLSALPSGPFGSPGGVMARGPQGSDGQVGRNHPTNPMGAEMFANRRAGFFDGKGLVGGAAEDRFKPYPERLKPMTEDSLKLPPEEHFKPFSLEQSHRVIDRRDFEEDLKQFPRPAYLDGESKFENHFSASRHLERVQHGFGVDRPFGFARDVVPDGSGSFPVDSAGPSVHPADTGERSRPTGLTDNMGKKMNAAGSHPDILGPVSEYGWHHMDMPPRSPVRDYSGVPPRRFGGSAAFGLGSHWRYDFDDKEPSAFGSGPFPGHLRRGEADGPRNFRAGPDHLRMLEPAGFGGFPSHVRMGELTGPGNLPSHRRIGEPGFGSGIPMYGSANEGGFFSQGSKGDMESFDPSRKRKPGSMGWCRICKIDCETVEGLDLHSQTREHQKMAMDMVLSIKQENAKKQKVSTEDRVSLEDANKSRKPGFENRGNRV